MERDCPAAGGWGRSARLISPRSATRGAFASSLFAAEEVSAGAAVAEFPTLITLKNRLPTPFPRISLSQTFQLMVWSPFDILVVSMLKKPMAPLLLANPGKTVAISPRNWL